MNTAYPPLRPVEPRPPLLPAHQDDQRSPSNYRLPSSSLVSANSLSGHLSISSSNNPNGNSNNNNNNNAEAGPSNIPSQSSSNNSANVTSTGLSVGAGVGVGVGGGTGGTGSGTGGTKKRVGVANARKRQRATAFDDVTGSGLGSGGVGNNAFGGGVGHGVGVDDAGGRPPAKQRESPKKKKAQRACAHCQKAHLTCDDNRPCTRCVKRNMAEKCIEGHRKKAKYLLDDAELEALKKGKPTPTVETPESQTLQSTPSVVDQFPTNDLYFNLPLDQTYAFGSEAANLEYSSLSAILGLNNYSPEQPFLTDTPPGSTGGTVAYVPGTTGSGGSGSTGGGPGSGGGGGGGGSNGPPFTNAAWPSEPQANIAPQALLGGQSVVGYDYGSQQQQQRQQQQQQQQQYRSQQDGGYGGQGMYDVGTNITIQQNGHHHHPQQQQGLGLRSITVEGGGGSNGSSGNGNVYGPQNELAYSQRQQQQNAGQSQGQGQGQGGGQGQGYLGAQRSMSLPTVPSQQQQTLAGLAASAGAGSGRAGAGAGSTASFGGTSPSMGGGADSPMSGVSITGGGGGGNSSNNMNSMSGGMNGYGAGSGMDIVVVGQSIGPSISQGMSGGQGMSSSSSSNMGGTQTVGVGSGPGSGAVSENGTPALKQGDTSLDVYTNVTKAYSYIESYQFLMKFLFKNFQKNDILRVIRALAIYRPSMIALQAPMSEEDFVFMEKCLRRTCIELEKLISYTGTPTVVWRRTGEICLVGVEFCLLTEWKKEELVTGGKYIYELFESQSVIEYWENFASHAFENTTQSVFSHCVLLKPSGDPIPCTFCFSIRRDIFDMPSVVIGQWLPLM